MLGINAVDTALQDRSSLVDKCPDMGIAELHYLIAIKSLGQVVEG